MHARSIEYLRSAAGRWPNVEMTVLFDGIRLTAFSEDFAIMVSRMVSWDALERSWDNPIDRNINSMADEVGDLVVKLEDGEL